MKNNKYVYQYNVKFVSKIAQRRDILNYIDVMIFNFMEKM